MPLAFQTHLLSFNGRSQTVREIADDSLRLSEEIRPPVCAQSIDEQILSLVRSERESLEQADIKGNLCVLLPSSVDKSLLKALISELSIFVDQTVNTE
ncbi:NAD/NADP transhydrogenase subunit beta, partial [Vibrio parahaemolyticus]|nr:NAD/NADP transhydrogenase subunit beta [Vibrio parahaemolyticus]